MCQTDWYPFDALKTSLPLDSLGAPGRPQCMRSAWRRSPSIRGTRTQMLARPEAGSHSSIWYGRRTPPGVENRRSAPLVAAWEKSKKSRFNRRRIGNPSRSAPAGKAAPSAVVRM